MQVVVSMFFKDFSDFRAPNKAYSLGFAVAFLDSVDILHRSIRQLIAWPDCSRMAIRIDIIETDLEIMQRMVKLEKIFAVSLRNVFMVPLPLSSAAVFFCFLLMGT